jgi:(2Fe-2S) ferredoxin
LASEGISEGIEPMVPREVWVCQHRNCQAQGSALVLAAFESGLSASDGVTVCGSECQGQCNLAVTVRVLPDQVWYCRVKAEDVPSIIEQHLLGNQPIQRLLHPRWH